MTPETPRERTRPALGLAEQARAFLTGVDGAAPPGWTRPAPGPEGYRSDVILGVAVAILIAVVNAFSLSSGIFNAFGEPLTQPLWLGATMPVAMGLALAVRRRFPMIALLWSASAFTYGSIVGYLEVFISPMVFFFIIYTAGAWSQRRTAVTLLRLVISVGLIVLTLVGTLALKELNTMVLDGSETRAFSAFTIILNVIYYLGAIWLGNVEYSRAGQRATMRAQFDELRRNRAQLADQAVHLDRVRIARELHDSVAHHVSLMGVQAALARKVLDTGRPQEMASAAIGQVESNAREAIDELQGILVALRSEDVQDPTEAPSTRSLDQIPALVEAVRAAGMRVDFHEYGDRAETTSQIAELTVYRVLQEALTNVRKHAGAHAAVDVRLRHRSDGIELDVTDDGYGVTDRANGGGGRGLIGMRERARAVGGTVVIGPRERRGFRVLLTVPVRVPEAPRSEASGQGAGHQLAEETS